MIEASSSLNTQLSYKRGISSFERFRIDYQLNQTWPPPSNHLTQFVAHLSLKGLRESTVKLYLAGIGYSCKLKGFQDTTQSFVVRKMVEGLRRLVRSADTRVPVTSSILQRIISVLPTVCKSSYEAGLFAAAYVTAFFGFFRVGELTTSHNGGSVNCLSVSDVTINSKEKTVMIRISRSKTDQEGRGSVIILRSTGTDLCPFQSMLRFLNIRPKVSGPLFCHFGGAPLTRYQFSAILQKAVNIVGLEGKGYKSHSFRIGAATSASVNGLSDEEIKILGRWRSGIVSSYIRIPTTKLLNV